MRFSASVARQFYYVIQTIRKEPVKQAYSELIKTQWLPKNKLDELQWNRLQSLINYAYEHISFYRKRFQMVGLKPSDIHTPEQFAKIPLLTKKDIQLNLGYPFSKRPSTLASTSGSSGTPLKIYRDNTSWAYHHANIFRGLSWYNIEIGAPYAMVGGIGSGFKNIIKGIIKDFLHNRIHLYANNMNKDYCRRFINKMKQFRPIYIYGYPSAIFDLACQMENENITLPKGVPKIVVTHGEELEPYQKEKIEAVMDTRVVNSYGCAEVGLIGFQCPDGGFHISVESIYLETDHDNSVIVTDLLNYVTPIIRYDLGDTLKMVESSCSCGRGLPIFTELKGKLRQVIELNNGRRIHSVFFNSLFKDLIHKGAPIEKYQIVRKKDDNFIIKLVPWDKLSSRHKTFLIQTLQKKFGEGCHFIIQIVDEIERSEAGKFRTYFEE